MSLVASLFAPAQALLLARLFEDPPRPYSVNELRRLTGLGSASLQRELGRLERGGLVVSEPVGNQRRVRADPRSAVYPELVALVRKALGVDAVLTDALGPLASRIDVAIVYGSVARDEDRADSDVDLMVVGDLTSGDVLPALLEAEARLGRRISPTCLSRQAFLARRADPGSFVSRVLSSPVRILMGQVDGLDATG